LANFDNSNYSSLYLSGVKVYLDVPSDLRVVVEENVEVASLVIVSLPE
jgi:hypothetical protein